MASMLMVSCRKKFWSPTEFSTINEYPSHRPRHRSRYRRAALGVPAGTGEPAPDSSGSWLQQRGARRPQVVPDHRQPDAAARVSGREQLGVHALVGFAWPGGAVGASFPFARQRAGESAPRFARLLSDLRSAGAVLDLNTHSLGAHVAFESLREGPPQVVRNAWNFASAVDNESIEVKSGTLSQVSAVSGSTCSTRRTIRCFECGTASATCSTSTPHSGTRDLKTRPTSWRTLRT